MPDGKARRGTLGRRIAEARAVLVFETLWPVAVALLALGAVFVALSWFGLWVVLPVAARVVGVAVFGGLVLALVVLAVRARLPGRGEALTRLDRDSGLPHRPISSSQDVLADPNADPETRALWDLHRRRLDAALRDVRVGAPSPRVVERDRYALRAAALLLLVAAGFVAGPDRAGRLAAAFNWRGGEAGGAAFRLDSWIDPPTYTGRPPIVLSASGVAAPTTTTTTRGQADTHPVAAPVGSAIVLRSAGEGQVDVLADGGIKAAPVDKAVPATAAPPPPDHASTGPAPTTADRRFILAGDGHVTVKRDGTPIAVYDLHAIPDLPPTIALDGRPVRNVRGSLTLRYTIGEVGDGFALAESARQGR